MITVETQGVLKKLNKIQRSLQDTSNSGPLHDYLHDMWQVGYKTLQVSYDSALTHDGEPAKGDVTLISEPKWYPDGFELIASGEEILFLEFGTGIFQTDIHPWGSQFGYIPRSYSAINKQFLFEPKTHHFHGSWPHGGKTHWGQNPAKGMYNASKEMRFFLQQNPYMGF